ncbi:MAG: cupin domain-containing protein, partial [Vicinamibacteria bacterium]
MTGDVLSDVLRAVRLTGAVYFDNDLSTPWVAETPPSSEIASRVMPGAQRVIEYHLIARGSCWGNAVGQEPVRL